MNSCSESKRPSMCALRRDGGKMWRQNAEAMWRQNGGYGSREPHAGKMVAHVIMRLSSSEKHMAVAASTCRAAATTWAVAA